MRFRGRSGAAALWDVADLHLGELGGGMIFWGGFQRGDCSTQ